MDHDTLNKTMEFDHVICVKNGEITEPNGVCAPEVYCESCNNGQILAGHEQNMIESVRRQGWSLLTGWTGQFSYSGPIMHPSEFVGGALADHILENDGLYVCVTVETLDNSEDAAGWAIAYRER
jgi:hypothetical protein